MLLGRVPGTNAYRVIACSRGPGKRDECSKELESHLGERVSFAGGNDSARIENVVELVTGGGSKANAFELGTGGVAVAVFPAFALKLEGLRDSIVREDIDVLKNGTRGILPVPASTTGWSFDITPYLANLTGGFDRVALTHIEDRTLQGSRDLYAVFVAPGDEQYQLVDVSMEREEAFGSVDLDGDGRDEFLLLRTNPTNGGYQYRLQRLIAGKPLAMAGSLPSEAWQSYDRLEDHDRSAK